MLSFVISNFSYADEQTTVLPFATKITGGFYIWQYQPLQDHGKNNLSLYTALLDLDATFGDYGFHFEPRFRETPLRPFFTSNVWFQEDYAFYKKFNFTVKVGKEYTHFGLFWDNSFYGDVHYFDGLKLNPEEGISLEGGCDCDTKFNYNYYLQFFVVDGSTNGSLGGRDVLSLPGAHKRNDIVARIEPTLNLAGDDKLTLGLSAQNFNTDIPAVPISDVERYAADLTYSKKLSYGAKFNIYGEFATQNGQTAVDYPNTGAHSNHNDYLLLGSEWSHGKWTARFNHTSVNYKDRDVKESTDIPGVVYALNDHINLLAEYAYWIRYDGSQYSLKDNSLNFILNGHF